MVGSVVPDYPVWLVLVLVFGYILAMFAVGYIALSRRVDISETEFFVTKWGTSYIGIAFSFAATFASAGYVMGTMGVFYDNPVALTGYVFGTMLSPIIWWWLARKLYLVGRRDSFSTPTDLIGDFYQSEPLRVITAFLIIIFFVPYMSVNLIAPAQLLEVTTGGAVPYWVGLLLMAGVVFVYVFAGGMRGVILTDIVQGALIYLIFFIAVPVFFLEAGGYSAILEAVPESNIAYGTGSTFEVWSLVVGWMLLLGLLNAFMPDRTTRLYTAQSVSQLKKGILAAAFLLGAFCIINLHFGWSANALDPQAGAIDHVIVELIGVHLYWLLGLFVVVLWAGGMSTLGSGVIGLAAMITKDIYRKNIDPDVSEERVYTIGRMIVTALLILAFFLSFRPPDFLWVFIAATASISIQWAPQMLGALYWDRSSKWGAYAGFIAGVAIVAAYTWVIDPPIPGVGGPLLLGLVANVILFVGISLVVEPPGDEEHRRRYRNPPVPREWL